MEQDFVMEENMLESNVDLEFIMCRVKRKMTNLPVNPQCHPASRNGESSGTGRGVF